MSTETNAARAAEIEALAAELKAEMEQREAMYPLAGAIVNSDAMNDKLDLFRAIVSALVKVKRETAQAAANIVTEHYQSLCTEHKLLLVNRSTAILERLDTPSPAAQPEGEK